jgi:hypothetical protein
MQNLSNLFSVDFGGDNGNIYGLLIGRLIFICIKLDILVVMKGGKGAPAAKPNQPAAKPTVAPVKQPSTKAFRAEDYATLIIPVEEVRDIKVAFDIFDSDLSGIVDPQELKTAFQALGFGGANKFIYQILAELDDDQSGGIDFTEFLRLATAKLSDKESRAEIDKVWTAFDVNKSVSLFLFRARFPLRS